MTKIFALLILLTPIFAFPAIEIMDSTTEVRSEQKSEPLQFRQDRKVGVGGAVGGSLGLAGVKVEFGIFKEDSFMLGFGGGSPFLAFSLEYKRIISGETFMPYYLGGYAHWSSNTKEGGMTSTSPEFVKEDLMSKEDIENGEISENLIYPGFGVQYYISDGAMKGSSFYLEALLLTDIEDFIIAPTGSLGYLYYF